MATTTWTANKDAHIAYRSSDATSLGAGTSNYNAVGLYTGYLYRALLGFNYSFAGIVSISSAILHVRTSVQYHVAFGSSPSTIACRITSSWSEGTSATLSGSNAVEWSNQPSFTLTNDVTFSPGTVKSTWKTVDVTAMVQDALAAGTFYGILLASYNETSSTRTSEFYSREGGSAPYISVTYSSNTAPTTPTSMTPTGGSFETSTPNLSFTHNDPESDALVSYDLQVSTDSSFATATHWDISAQTSGISGDNVTRAYAGTSLSAGTTYYWRARTNDGSLTGAWSAAQQFAVRQTPTATLTEPSASGRLGKVSYTAGSGWAAPRLNVAWSFNCPDAGTQASYEVDVANDSSGSPGSSLYASGTVAGTASSLVVPATLTEGNYYHVRVRVTCEHGATSSYDGYYLVRTRWGVVAHRFDATSAPVEWSISTLNTTTSATSAVTVEYGSDPTANSSPASGWLASIAEASLERYFYYRAWLLSWGASPATSASLDKLVLSYSSNVLVADKWTREDTSYAAIDLGTFVYGTQSLKMLGKGSTHSVYQQVAVTPNTDYILSGRIKASGNANALIAISSSGTSGTLEATTAITGTADWARYNTAVWNSGANTSVYVRAVVSGSGGTVAWFDALKIEAASVVTPWTPSFLGDAVILDAGGLQIDGSNGGVFRLRAATGGTRDRVDLGDNGLQFGGDTEVYSPAAGVIRIDDHLRLGADVDLYRSAADVLKTDDSFVAGAVSGSKDQITIPDTTAGAGLTIGGDTNLYRSAADTLKTDDTLNLYDGDLVYPSGKRPWRYVSLSAYSEFVTFTASTADDASPTAVEVTAIPANTAVAIEVISYLSFSSGTAANTSHAMLFDYGNSDGNPAALDLYPSPTVTYYNSMRAMVLCGGTNGRQIYRQFLPGTKTCTWLVRAIGYWVEC